MVSKNDIRISGIFDFQAFPILENAKTLGSGNNLKNILVCCAGEMTPELTSFLEKVIASVGVNISADAFLLNLQSNQKLSFSQLDREMNFEKAIFFGLRPNEVGLNFDAKPYEPFQFNGKSYLFVHTINQVQEKQELKRPLWEALKGLFGK